MRGGKSEIGTILWAYKIAVDDTGRVHVFESALSSRDKEWPNVAMRTVLTRIWYKKY